MDGERASSSARRVFVVGGYVARGGTHMAYHAARVIVRRLGLEGVVVTFGDEGPESSPLEFPESFPTLRLDALAGAIRQEDILLANPSLSDYLFGLRLPGTKVMYVQGFSAFRLIDGFFDHYVAVSACVQRLVGTVYGFWPPVIPAFVDTGRIPGGPPWAGRPRRSVLVHHRKHHGEALLVELESRMEGRHPGLRYTVTRIPDYANDRDSMISQRALFELMSSHRYFLTLSGFEGFNLPALEAMACGCTVVGFDCCGGREYMRTGVNCSVFTYPRLDGVVDALAQLLRDEDAAEGLAGQAAADARAFDYASFERRWIDFVDTRRL